ncbi:MAG: hypothetical protein F4X63_02895 [Nitrospira sp. SB0662_bin_26]|nr:hypothetical protein [Nitrospira sp. SB0662_bin_26]
MSSKNELDTVQVLDAFGELIAAVATLAAQVPAKTFSAIPGGIRPTEEATEKYETVVYRFRDQAGPPYRVLYAFFVDSLEAFEAGRIFDAVPPLLQAIERLVDLHKEEKVSFNSAEQNRIREFQQRLEKILPEASKPEVDLPTPETY